MKVCIAGGGRVGRYLAQSLLANHHEIVIYHRLICCLINLIAAVAC